MKLWNEAMAIVEWKALKEKGYLTSNPIYISTVH